LFDAAVNGTVVYKFDANAGAYLPSITKNKITGKWNDTTTTLLPGEGVFVKNPATTNVTITFVGEVMQGSLTNALPAGYSIASSQVPQADTLDNLGFPKTKGDVVYRFVGGAYVSYSVNKITGNWTTVPSVGVAEAFFVKKATAADWTRNFSVNQ